MVLTPTPPRLVEDGRVNFGLFDAPFRDLNILDCPTGLPTRALRRLRLKEWEHFAIVHPDLYISLALVDAKIICSSWCYLLDRRSGKASEQNRKLPPGRLTLPPTLWNGKTAFRATGYAIELHNHLDQGRHVLTFEIDAGPRGQPAVAGRLVLHEQPGLIQPLIPVLPLGPGRPVYSHKIPAPLTGELQVGGESFRFDATRDLALLDVHKAYYPRHTFWRWATFAALDRAGEPIGVNLTHNVIEDDSRFNENAIWHGRRLSSLAAARFEIPTDPMEPWRVATTDGRAELTFTPRAMRQEELNLLIANSSYRQPVGTFSGTLTDQDGTVHRISDAFGIAEDHRVVW